MNVDTRNSCSELNIDADVLHQPSKCVNERAGAAHGEVDPPATLEEMNQVVNAGGVEWIATDEQGLDGESLAQPVVLEMPANKLPDTAIGAQTQEGRHLPDHRGKRVKGLVGELFETDLEDPTW